MHFLQSASTAAALMVLASTPASAFWRMSCGIVQYGRIDPITNPGTMSPHAHKIAGASNIGMSSTYESLRQSNCTACTVQADLSAYWTPQLYYQHGDGSFESVENNGMAVYYLGRGDDRANIVPFPEGFRSLSGNNAARAYDATTKTWDGSRPIADRVSYACLGGPPSKEQPGMSRTDCSDGLRAQVHFPSCWDGKNLYMPDQSHTAYMSSIDNGKCPPTHPKLLPHIFFEVLYNVAKIQKSAGGKFVFSQGDATGFGFHGDFMNGWDTPTLTDAIKQCVNTDDGKVEDCAPLVRTNDDKAQDKCPVQKPLNNEQVLGKIAALPGANGVTGDVPQAGASGAAAPSGGAAAPSGGAAMPSGGAGGAGGAAAPSGDAAPAATPAKSSGKAAASSASGAASTMKTTVKAAEFAAPTASGSSSGAAPASTPSTDETMPEPSGSASGTGTAYPTVETGVCNYAPRRTKSKSASASASASVSASM